MLAYVVRRLLSVVAVLVGAAALVFSTFYAFRPEQISDGTGYPRGLQGCDLTIETRILAACDVYDALVSDRVYRAAWTPERALALLHEESGTGFDPKVIDALQRVVEPRDGSPSWVAGLTAPATGSTHGPARAAGSWTPHT